MSQLLYLTMYGPHFLLLFIILLVSGCSLIRYMPRIFGQKSYTPLPIPSDPDPYEIAYIRGGIMELGKVLAFNLIRRKYIEVRKSGNQSRVLVKKARNHASVSNLSKIEQLFFNCLPSGHTELKSFIGGTSFVQLMEEYMDRTYPTLGESYLVLTSEHHERLKKIRRIIIGSIMFIGISKLVYAVAMGYGNFTFLVILIIFGLVALTTVKPLNTTKNGQLYISRLQTAFQSEREKGTTVSEIEHLMLLASVYGLTFLAATQYSYLTNYFAAITTASYGGFYSSCSGCGSSCSSGYSSSCGSSCGGGCGGCGGCGG